MVFYIDSVIVKEGFLVNYSVLQSSVLEDFKCMEVLGMELGEIYFDQIIVFFQYSINWFVECFCLNYFENGWIFGEDFY